MDLTPLSRHGDPDPKGVGSSTATLEKQRKEKGLTGPRTIVTGSAPRPESEHNHSKSAALKVTSGNQAYGIVDDDCTPVPPLQWDHLTLNLAGMKVEC